MRKVGFVAFILSIFAFGSLPSGAPPKPGTHTPVPLIVTMNACDTSVLAEICGDDYELDGSGDTTYTDGQDGVRASIDQYGNVIIDFQTTRAKIRGLVYKYGSMQAPPGGGSNHYLSTIEGTALQAMLIGEISIKTSCPLYDDDSGQPQYPAWLLPRLSERLWIRGLEARGVSGRRNHMGNQAEGPGHGESLQHYHERAGRGTRFRIFQPAVQDDVDCEAVGGGSASLIVRSKPSPSFAHRRCLSSFDSHGYGSLASRSSVSGSNAAGRTRRLPRPPRRARDDEHHISSCAFRSITRA